MKILQILFIDFVRFKIGSLIYKCEDGDVNIRGMINNFKE